MHYSTLFAVGLLGFVCTTPIQHNVHSDTPNIPPPSPASPHKKLNGRFLHISGIFSFNLTFDTTDVPDLHPDPFYKVHASTEEGIACHRGSGPAGTYGAETSDCDTPFSLVNATFKWIADNIRDEIDFVVWTGDSARHDSDEEEPRSAQQVLSLNNYIVGKFIETFSDENHDLTIPIVPTFGNNDILPHNILLAGPNKWLRTYTSVWQKFIPEAQRHGFERGGWFYVEVIPNELAVFSLNTLYFFDHNSGVDGCIDKSEPGFEHMEWLRIQLQFIRERGMKAMLMGHVPPARTDTKTLWDETCWQKYTLWLQQFRDVVVASFYGHMNIDHFLLQDTRQVDLALLAGLDVGTFDVRELLDEELTTFAAANYLEELRESWSSLPNPSVAIRGDDGGSDGVNQNRKSKKGRGKKSKKDRKEKELKKMGGEWAERYQLSVVGPSVVPNFFPTLRVFEYNMTGLDETRTWADAQSASSKSLAGRPSRHMSAYDHEVARLDEILGDFEGDIFATDADEELDIEKKKRRKGKKPKTPNLNVPAPPAKTAPPGPAYSPQSLTLLGYTQYFANLTHINNDFTLSESSNDDFEAERWKEGKHKKKHPKDKHPKPRKFEYEVEYNTFNDSKGYRLKDLTVRSYVKLAHHIGQYDPNANNRNWNVMDLEEDDDEDYEGRSLSESPRNSARRNNISAYIHEAFNGLFGGLRKYTILVSNEQTDASDDDDDGDDGDDDIEAQGKKKRARKHKKKKHHKGKNSQNKAWYTFVKRAFVGVMDADEIKNFSVEREAEVYDVHDEYDEL